MNRVSLLSLSAASALAIGSSASAVIVDGVNTAAEYGPALSTQSIGTGFGDNFNELDEAFGNTDDGTVNLLVTGNLETNGNRFVLLIDTGDNGGAATVPASGDNFDQNLVAGDTFDVAPEYMLFIAESFGNLFASLRDLTNDTEVVGVGLGSVADFNTNGGVTSGSFGGLSVAWDNTNTGGVGGDAGVADSGAGATAGFEFSLDPSLLGNPTDDLNVTALIVASSGFYSNQFLGPLPETTGNLGDGVQDLTLISGDQFFTVTNTIPEPASLALLALGGAVALGRRRK
ncbi:MAG: PEP-CTERM sorting domain-containing protein [Planctomycetota bacterium]